MVDGEADIHIQIAGDDDKGKVFYSDTGVGESVSDEALVIFVLDADLVFIFLTEHPGRKQLIDIQPVGLQVNIPYEPVFAHKRGFEPPDTTLHLQV